MKISCPQMGEYTNLVQELCDYLGWEFISTPRATDRSMELGSKHMGELMCLPAKTTLGSFIDACDKGATDLIMFDSCGECRLKTYWILQQRALKKLRYNATVHPVRLGWSTPGDIKVIDPSLSSLKCWRAFIRLLLRVKELDDKNYIEILDESRQVKVGIVGEIFTIHSSETNKRLIEKIEKMGALVHNSLPLSYFIFKRLYNRGWMKRRGVDRNVWLAAKERAEVYFPKETGGHGKESIIHSIYYGMKHYDGVIHLLPFPCSPEATVAPILDDISHDYSIPMMRLIFDTHTGEAGLDTRLEAFVDILKRKKGKKL
jgi:predicted nucleotide-binding protein (sugar kinase/HSP70/actin superfamily)